MLSESIHHHDGQGTSNSPWLIHVLCGISDTDVVLMMDTWLTSGDVVKWAELKPDGYDQKDNPRPSGRIDGGIGILFKTGIR